MFSNVAHISPDHGAIVSLYPKKILVATDLSSVCNQALHYAAMLARRYSAQILLLHVLSPEDPQIKPAMTISHKRTQTVKQLGEIVAAGGCQDVQCEIVLEQGSLWPVIERLIYTRGIDLLVTGTHGLRSDLTIQGSSAELIFRHANIPVLTVGPDLKNKPAQGMTFRTILFPTDFGRSAARAAPYALSLAQECNARLVLLNVLEKVTSFYSEEGMETLKQTTLLRLREYLPGTAQNTLDSELVLKFGDPPQCILEVAKTEEADLIVMGAKAGSTMAAHVPQTVAFAVAAESPCPVLTVRA